MTGENKKNQKRLSFRGDSVYWPDENTRHDSAKSLEWQLIRAALRGEPCHWMDGFIFLASWHEKEQRDTDYIAMFRTIRSNANNELESLGVEHLEIAHSGEGSDLWQLYRPAEAFECDITEAVQKARQARDELRKGSIETGWRLIREAFETYGEHLDAGSICQALVFADSLPENGETYETCLAWIRERLDDYRNTLIKASAKVVGLALKERQGINGQIAGPAIDRWIEALNDVDQVLLLLTQKMQIQPAPVEPKIKEFVRLANECGKYIDYMRKDDFADRSAELKAANRAFEALSEQLRQCALVVDIAEETVRHYEGLEHPAASRDEGSDYLRAALHDFLMTSAFPIQESNSIEAHISRYLRKYVGQFYRAQGITDIFGSKVAVADKQQQLMSLFESTTNRERARQLLGTMTQQMGSSPADQGETVPKRLHEPSPLRPLAERLAPMLGRFPTKDDLEGGRYYANRGLHEDIMRILQGNRRCLVVGKPGCGKTTLALAIGYEFSQGLNRHVYYHDLAFEPDESVSVEAIRACDEDVLIILDNIHARIEEINSLLCNIGPHRAMLFLVALDLGREVTLSTHPDGSGSVSYVDILSQERSVKQLQVDHIMLRSIIDRLSEIGRVDRQQMGNAAALLRKCSGDLHILRFYLGAWERKGRVGCLSDMQEEAILDDVYAHYLQGKSYLNELLRLSALSQLEIPVDARWIGRAFHVMQKDGLLDTPLRSKIQQGSYRTWLRLYHPTPARYFLLAAAFNDPGLVPSVDEFTLSCLQDHIRTAPHNILNVLWQLHAHGQSKWCSLLFSDPEVEVVPISVGGAVATPG